MMIPHKEEDYAKLTRLISSGIPPRLASEYAGFDRRTYSQDMENGLDDSQAMIDSPEAKFYKAVTEGREAFVTKQVEDIAIQTKDMRSKMELLSKMEKDDFGDDSQSGKGDKDRVVIVNDVPLPTTPKEIEAGKPSDSKALETAVPEGVKEGVKKDA